MLRVAGLIRVIRGFQGLFELFEFHLFFPLLRLLLLALRNNKISLINRKTINSHINPKNGMFNKRYSLDTKSPNIALHLQLGLIFTYMTP